MGVPATKRTPFDIILAAFKTNTVEQLNQDYRDELARWNFADNILRTYQDTKTILGMIQTKFEVSLATAYRDIAHAKRFFGSQSVNEKDYYRMIYTEELEELAKLSKQKGDYKNAISAIKEAAEIRGLKDGDEVVDLYKQLEPSQFIFGITIIENGVKRTQEINLDRLNSIDDAEFEIISNAIESTPSVSEEQMIKLLNSGNE